MRISIPIPSHAQLHGGGFEAGFYHPVLGIDHLLAMVSVGIISAMIGGRAIYSIPAAFVLTMITGAVAGFYNLSFLNDEFAIAVSVLLLGLIIAISKKIPIVFIMLFVMFFAYFHGHAHGVEMPKISSKLEYIGGFVLATVGLHLMGVAIVGLFNKFSAAKKTLSNIGSFIAGIGFYILYTKFF